MRSPYRAKIKSIQLVSLISSKIWKKHGNHIANKRLLDDLKFLEEVGIRVSKPFDHLVKAGLGAFVGDNLGLHQLGELNSVFSSGNICRVCKADYKSVCTDSLAYAGVADGFEPELFTAREYDALADEAVENGAGSNTCGIKGHCILNSLQSFHCITGFPPCLGVPSIQHSSF